VISHHNCPRRTGAFSKSGETSTPKDQATVTTDEGLTLDYARRLLHAPSTLYQKSVVPMPLVYTPLLAAVLVVIVVAFAEPLRAARVVAILWTAAIAAAYRLVRSRVSTAGAIVLLPFDLTFATAATSLSTRRCICCLLLMTCVNICKFTTSSGEEFQLFMETMALNATIHLP
jgi:hypothetical protein